MWEEMRPSDCDCRDSGMVGWTKFEKCWPSSSAMLMVLLIVNTIKDVFLSSKNESRPLNLVYYWLLRLKNDDLYICTLVY